MDQTASSQSPEAPTDVMDYKSFVKSPDEAPPTLVSLPAELQLRICREMLWSQSPITLSPCTPYVSEFAFGSLGILRVSKYFSTMALGIMYGENCFYFGTEQYTVTEGYSKHKLFTVDIETLRHGPWQNLRDLPHTEFFNVVSPIDCLDMISQTSSGQISLKRLEIGFDLMPWVHIMDGVLVRMLKRMRGLQSVKLDFDCFWFDVVDDTPFVGVEEPEERTARDLLLLIREELSHIKMITIEWNKDLDDINGVEAWMTHELEKRNETWAPPLPRYKTFRRTFSPMSSMDAAVATAVVQFKERSKPKRHSHSLFHLERKYGVFW